jgi:hypothetical protein
MRKFFYFLTACLCTTLILLSVDLPQAFAEWEPVGGSICGGDPDCVEELWAVEDSTYQICTDGVRFEFASDVESKLNGGLTVDDGASFPNTVTYINAQDITLQPLDTPIVAGDNTYISYYDARIPWETQPALGEDVTIFVFGGQGGGNEFSGDTTVQNCSIMDGVPVTSAPSNLGARAEGSFLPTYASALWEHKTSAGATGPGGSWYRVYVQLNGGQFYDQWYDANEICTGVLCDAPIETEVLPKGQYQFWVGAYVSPGDIRWSTQPGIFTIDMKAPEPPEFIEVLPREGRPLINFDNTFSEVATSVSYAQVYIGDPASNNYYLQWHKVVDGDTCTNTNTLQECQTFIRCYGYPTSVCELTPPADFVAGTYQVWAQYWGPGGFSNADGTGADGAGAWVQGPNLVLPDDPATTPTNLQRGFGVAGAVFFSWGAGENSTWYNVRLKRQSDNVETYNRWFSGPSDLGCVFQGEQCTLDNSLVDQQKDVNYIMEVQAWGPGGFSGITSFSFTGYDPVSP